MSTYLTSRTKGLRLREPVPADGLDEELRARPLPLDGGLFSWPLLTIDDAALTHNIGTMADLCGRYGVWHAPHVKTHMCRAIWERQAAAGAWAATVATPTQVRTVVDWEAKRVLLANELVEPLDGVWLRRALLSDPDLEVWLQVDSLAGVEFLATYLGGVPNLHVLVEFGVPAGRTGVRTVAEAVELAGALSTAGLSVAGITGYEGPAATGTSPDELAKVRRWCEALAEVAREVRAAVADTGDGSPRLAPRSPNTGSDTADGSSYPTSADNPAASPGSHYPAPDAVSSRDDHASADTFIVSVGGSAYLDVILDCLAPLDRPAPTGPGTQVVLRSGSYVTHDSEHYAELNPWQRLPGNLALHPALTVWAQVLSLPEPGLALLGAGRRDVSFDAGLPVPLWYRPGWTAAALDERLHLGPRTPFPEAATITALNDQHAFLTGPGTAALHIGDIVGLGISHPCTTFDKWRIAILTTEDPVTTQTLATGLYALDF